MHQGLMSLKGGFDVRFARKCEVNGVTCGYTDHVFHAFHAARRCLKAQGHQLVSFDQLFQLNNLLFADSFDFCQLSSGCMSDLFGEAITSHQVT